MKTLQIILRHRVAPGKAKSACRPLCMWVSPPDSEYNTPYDALVERWKAFEKDMADVRSQREGPLRWNPPTYKNDDYLLQKHQTASAKPNTRGLKKQVPRPTYTKFAEPLPKLNTLEHQVKLAVSQRVSDNKAPGIMTQSKGTTLMDLSKRKTVSRDSLLKGTSHKEMAEKGVSANEQIVKVRPPNDVQVKEFTTSEESSPLRTDNIAAPQEPPLTVSTNHEMPEKGTVTKQISEKGFGSKQMLVKEPPSKAAASHEMSEKGAVTKQMSEKGVGSKQMLAKEVPSKAATSHELSEKSAASKQMVVKEPPMSEGFDKERKSTPESQEETPHQTHANSSTVLEESEKTPAQESAKVAFSPEVADREATVRETSEVTHKVVNSRTVPTKGVPPQEEPVNSTQVAKTVSKSAKEPRKDIVESEVREVQKNEIKSVRSEETSPPPFFKELDTQSPIISDDLVKDSIPLDRKNYEAIRKYIAEAEIELRVQKQMLNTQRQELKKRLRRMALNPLAEIERSSKMNLQHPLDYFNKKNKTRQNLKKTLSKASDITRNTSTNLAKSQDSVPVQSQPPGPESISASGSTNMAVQDEDADEANSYLLPDQETEQTIDRQVKKAESQKRSKEILDVEDEAMVNQKTRSTKARSYRQAESIVESDIDMENATREMLDNKITSKRSRSAPSTKRYSVRDTLDHNESSGGNVPEYAELAAPAVMNASIANSKQGKTPVRIRSLPKLKGKISNYEKEKKKLMNQNLPENQTVQRRSEKRTRPKRNLPDNDFDDMNKATKIELKREGAQSKMRRRQDTKENIVSHNTGFIDDYNTIDHSRVARNQDQVYDQGFHNLEGEDSVPVQMSETREIPQQVMYKEIRQGNPRPKKTKVSERGHGVRAASLPDRPRVKVRQRIVDRNAPLNVNQKSGNTYYPGESTVPSITKPALDSDDAGAAAEFQSRKYAQSVAENNFTRNKRPQDHADLYASSQDVAESYKPQNLPDQSNTFFEAEEFPPQEWNGTAVDQPRKYSTSEYESLPPSYPGTSDRMNVKQRQSHSVSAKSVQNRGKYRHDSSNRPFHADAYVSSVKHKPIPEYDYYNLKRPGLQANSKKDLLASNRTQFPRPQMYDEINESHVYPQVVPHQKYDPLSERTEITDESVKSIDRDTKIRQRLNHPDNPESNISSLRSKMPPIAEEEDIGDNQTEYKESFTHSSDLVNQSIPQKASLVPQELDKSIRPRPSHQKKHPTSAMNSRPKQIRYTPEIDFASFVKPDNVNQKPLKPPRKQNQLARYSYDSYDREGLAAVDIPHPSTKLHSTRSNYPLQKLSQRSIINRSVATDSNSYLEPRESFHEEYSFEDGVNSSKVNMQAPLETVSGFDAVRRVPVTHSSKAPTSFPRFKARSLDGTRESSVLSPKTQSIRSHSLMSSRSSLSSKLNENINSYLAFEEEFPEYRPARVVEQDSRPRFQSKYLGGVDLESDSSIQPSANRPLPEQYPASIKNTSRSDFSDDRSVSEEREYSTLSRGKHSSDQRRLFEPTPPEHELAPPSKVVKSSVSQHDQKTTAFKNALSKNSKIYNKEEMNSFEREEGGQTHTRFVEDSVQQGRTASANEWPVNTTHPRDFVAESLNDNTVSYQMSDDLLQTQSGESPPQIPERYRPSSFDLVTATVSEKSSENQSQQRESKDAVTTFHPQGAVPTQRSFSPSAKFRPRFVGPASFNVNNFDSVFSVDESVKSPGYPIRKWKVPPAERTTYVASIPHYIDLS